MMHEYVLEWKRMRRINRIGTIGRRWRKREEEKQGGKLSNGRKKSRRK